MIHFAGEKCALVTFTGWCDGWKGKRGHIHTQTNTQHCLRPKLFGSNSFFSLDAVCAFRNQSQRIYCIHKNGQRQLIWNRLDSHTQTIRRRRRRDVTTISVVTVPASSIRHNSWQHLLCMMQCRRRLGLGQTVDVAKTIKRCYFR